MTIQHPYKRLLFGVGAFLAAWQIADFDLDYRTMLGAFTAAWLAAANPAKPDTGTVSSTGESPADAAE